MKALVIGARGQVGRALLSRAPAGWSVSGVARDGLDVADSDAVRRYVLDNASDVVINAAAYTAVDRAESEPALAQAINADAVGAMVDAARETGAHLVHVSTDFVFPGNDPRPLAPDAARAPLSVYGRTKAAGEDAAGPDSTVVRTAWVYAAGGANFVNTMLRLMREREEIRVVADQIGAPTWASGLADVLWGLAGRRQGGTWHWSDAGTASWYDFAVAIEEEARALGLLGRPCAVLPITTADYPTPAARPAFSLLDSAATRAALGMDAVHWRVNLRAMLGELEGQ